MKKVILITAGLLVLTFTFAGCTKNSTKKQAEADHDIILNYASSPS